jgi:hypothetical protein
LDYVVFARCNVVFTVQNPTNTQKHVVLCPFCKRMERVKSFVSQKGEKAAKKQQNPNLRQGNWENFAGAVRLPQD